MQSLLLLFQLALSGAAAALLAAGASAPMMVAATVVRSCTVGSQTGTAVKLECSRGVNRVSVTTVGALTSSFSISVATTSDIRTLGAGVNSVDVPDSRPVQRDQTVVEDGTLASNVQPPLVVTFNF